MPFALIGRRRQAMCFVWILFVCTEHDTRHASGLRSFLASRMVQSRVGISQRSKGFTAGGIDRHGQQSGERTAT